MVVESHAVSSADGRSFLIVDLVFSLYRVLPLCKLLLMYTSLMSSGTREDYLKGRKKMESFGLGDGQPGIWMGTVLCDFNVNRQLPSGGSDGCKRGDQTTSADIN